MLQLAVATAGVDSQPTAADYERAARFVPGLSREGGSSAGGAKSSAGLDEYVLNGEIQYAWLGDGERFYYSRRTATGRQFVLVDAMNGIRRPAFDHRSLARALGTSMDSAVNPADLPFSWFEFVDGMRAIEFDSKDKRWHCALGEACKEIAHPAQIEGVVSPDGRWVLVRKEANVWLRSLQDGTERPLTTGGTTELSYGGRDGLGQMLKRWPSMTVALWSPDSRKVLVERTDVRGVPPRYHLQEAPEDGSLRPKLFAPRVALPGDSHTEHVESLVLFEIATGKRVEVRHPSLERNAYSLIDDRPKRILWSADSRTLFAAPSEPSRKIVQLLEVDAGNGAIRELFEESSATYVDPDAAGMGRGSLLSTGEVLWRSERSDWSHLYLYDRAGKLRNAVTAGEWRVTDVVRVDERRRQVYFTASGRERGEDLYQQHLYVVNLDGSGLQLLTPEDAHHFVDLERAFSPSGNHFIETFSRPDLAPVTVLRDRHGKEVLKLETADTSKLQASGFVPPEPFRVLADDGRTPLFGNVFRPATFDSSKCYPVVDVIYPGPQSYRTRKSFIESLKDEPQGLAELGFIVVTIDGRGTAGRSKSFHDVSYGNMQQAGNLADHVAGIRQLAKRYPYMDLDRVGISGWSAGGFAATRAMLEYPDFYKVGTSTAGDQDVRQVGPFQWATVYQGPYDAERWAPMINARLADRLQGKLLLIQGDMDTAVHPAVTMQLVEALIKADKDFDLLVLPNGDHKVHFEPYVVKRRADYFVRHLLGQEPKCHS